jgi:D-lyxose ketol-isomerase
MRNSRKLNRRSLLRAAAPTAALAALGVPAVAAPAAESCCGGGPRLRFSNDEFYDAEGKFVLDKARKAFQGLMQYHGYPIFDGLVEGLWVSDYGLGRFPELGLGAHIYMNEEGPNYLMLDIFLLPDQMLPEHYHVKTDKAAAKMEGWLCRWGRSYVYGEGPKTEDLHAKIPEYERKWVTVWHETVIDPGQCTHLNRPTARHWQFAGPEGAILTEVGTFHDGAAVRHTDPNIVFG